MHEVLLKHNDFYRKLPRDLQLDFKNRVNNFLIMKEIRGKGGEAVSFEQRVAVSSAAIQVTFGSNDYFLDKFHTIIIYPETYINPLTGNLHRGEVNPMQGIIVISWKDFLFGNQIVDDHFNVGLHEMGHAFFFNLHYLRDEAKLSFDLLSKFLYLSEAEIIRIRQNHSTLFRTYAGENPAEFFAIAVEYFFEQGDLFREKLPELYKQMCLVLKMDPLRKKYRNLDLSEYFNQRNFDDYHLNIEPVLLNKKQTGYHVSFPYTYQSSVLFGFILALFTMVSISAMSGGGILFSLLLIVSIIPLFRVLFKQHIEASENYLIVHKKSFFGNKIMGIHFDNILSVDFANYDTVMEIRYFNNNSLKIMYIAKNKNAGNQLPIFMVKRNIMIKKEGKRIARIKNKTKF